MQVSEQRRVQIVESARRIVDEQGPGRLTAEAITREVGVSRPLLYHYFANMGDLLDAVMDAYLGEFEECLNVWETAWDADAACADRTGWAASLVAALRTVLVDGCPLLRGVDDRPQAAPSAYLTFLARCADIAARRALDEEIGAYAPCRAAALSNPHAAMHFAVCGLAETLRSFPGLSDSDAARMLCALWADDAPARQSASKPADPDPAADPQLQPEKQPVPRKGLFGRLFNTGG